MKQTEELYRAFLDEMHSLEEFRMAYAAMHPTVALEREDPDVRRLMEAMAFFNARTRSSSLKNILGTHRRLFQQFFSFLLTPLPAQAVLRAEPTGRFAEPVVLPRDTEVVVTTAAGERAFFKTIHEMRILPIALEGIDTLLRPREGVRIALRFKAAFARTDDLGTLRLRVNHLDDYRASLLVFWNLERHLESASVLWEEKPTDASEGVPCKITFGAPADAELAAATPNAPGLGDLLHPIQKVRSFFHLPERDLYLNVAMPPSPRNWRRFSIILDLKPSWPKTLRLNPDVFELFTVPLVNLRRAMAKPFLCDGTAERYAIRHPEPAAGYALHSVTGVYEITKAGLVPIRPGTLVGGSGSYEVERAEPDGDGNEPVWLKLHMPEAFEQPKKIAVEGLWHQPWLARAALAKPKVTLRERSIEGAEFDIPGEIRPPIDNRLRNDFDQLLQILALKNKAMLELGDILALLGALGCLPTSAFKQVPDLLSKVDVGTVPLPRDSGAGMRHVYRFELREFDPTFRPVVEVALREVRRLLDAWSSDATVAVEALVPGTGERIAFPS